MRRVPGVLRSLCYFLYGVALLSFIGAMGVQNYYDHIDMVASVPLAKTNRLSYHAGRSGEYWISLIVSPASRTMKESDLVSGVSFDEISATEKDHSIPVARVASSGIGDEITDTFASINLRAGHDYVVNVNCSNYEKLASGHKVTLTVQPSPSTNSFRNNSLMNLAILMVGSLAAAIVVTLACLFSLKFP